MTSPKDVLPLEEFEHYIENERELFFSAMTAALSSLSFGFNIGATNAPIEVFSKCSPGSDWWSCFPVSENEWSFMSSLLCLGALFGSLASSRFADQFGRLWALRWNNAIYCVGMACFVIAPNYGMLLLGRFLIGVGVGVSCVVVPMYLTEISPLAKRGIVSFMHQLAIVIGLVLVEAVYLLTGVQGGMWRAAFALNLALQLVQSVLLTRCQESTKWLHSNVGTDQTSSSFWQIIALPQARKSLIVAMFLHFAQQASGINGVFFFSRALFPASRYTPLWLAILNVAMTFVSMFLIERNGRKGILLLSLFGMSASAFCVGVLVTLGFDAVAPIAILLYVAFFAVGLGPVPWLVMSELFPIETVAVFVPLAVAVNWVSNMTVTAVFLPLKNVLSLGVLFGSISVGCAVLAALAMMLVVETRARPASYLA